MSADGASRVPDLILEQYRLNELPADEAERIASHLRRDPALRSRLEALERSDEEIARAYPRDWLAQRIRARVSAPTPPVHNGLVRPLALTSAFATVVLVLLIPLVTNSDSDRVKGLAPSLAVYRRTAEGSEKLADGAVARPGDLLRVGYVAGGRDYGVILSIDGRGVVTRHLPVEGESAVLLRKEGPVLLDAAFELDDAPAWERFYFVTADQPFAIAPVLDAARRAATSAPRIPTLLPLARTFAQNTFSLQKEVKP